MPSYSPENSYPSRVESVLARMSQGEFHIDIEGLADALLLRLQEDIPDCTAVADQSPAADVEELSMER